MQALSINRDDRILVIAPHPDDECIGAGGLLCLYNDQCDVLVLTDGALGQGDISLEECRKLRRKEFIAEMKFANIRQYSMLDVSDGTLMEHSECLMNIDLKSYTKIFVTGERDNHPDHTAAFVCLREAIKKQSADMLEIYQYEVHNPLACPTHYLNITSCIDNKIGLIRKHKSQLSKVPYDEYAKTSGKYRAIQNRMSNEYIEVYSLVDISSEGDVQQLELQKKLQKFSLFYQVLTKWMIKESIHSIESYLKERDVKRVSIYGYAELGEILRLRIEKSIEVAYILDKKVTEDPKGEIAFCYPRAGLPKVDLIIVTAIYYYKEIRQELSKMGYSNIISLPEIIDHL